MRPLLVLLSMAVIVSLVTLPDHLNAQDNGGVGGPDADVDCDQLLAQSHAQAIFDAAATNNDPDPYGLDENENGDACDGRQGRELGTGRNLAACENFRERRHAQALYEASDGNPRYELNTVNGVACRGSGPSPTPQPPATRQPTTVPPTATPTSTSTPTPRPPAPTPSPPTPTPRPPTPTPPSTGLCDGTRVENGRAVICAGGDVTVDPFAGFDAFAASAAGGFGRAPDSTLGDAIRTGVQQAAPTGGVASFQQTAGQQTTGDGPAVVSSKQKASKKAGKQRAKSRKQRAKQRQRARDGQDQRRGEHAEAASGDR